MGRRFVEATDCSGWAVATPSPWIGAERIKPALVSVVTRAKTTGESHALFPRLARRSILAFERASAPRASVQASIWQFCRHRALRICVYSRYAGFMNADLNSFLRLERVDWTLGLEVLDLDFQQCPRLHALD